MNNHTEFMKDNQGTKGAVSHSQQTTVNGEVQEDPEELTSGDFQQATGGIGQRAADAVNYVKQMVMPGGENGATNGAKDASNDPEVNDFRQAAGETMESFSETSDDGSSKGPQSFSTKSVTAGNSAGKQQPQGFGDMARNTAGSVQQKLSPQADAAPRGEDESAGTWARRQQYNAAETGEKAADKTSGWFASQKHKAEEHIPSDEDASQDLSAAAREARDKIAGAGQYVKERFTAPAGGPGGREPVEEAKQQAQETKGWFFSKKNKAQDSAHDSAQSARGWFGGKVDEASDRSSGKGQDARTWLGNKGDQVEEGARDTGKWAARKTDEAGDEAEHQANKARGWFSDKSSEAEDKARSTSGWLGQKTDDARDEADQRAGSARGWLNKKSGQAQDAAEDTQDWASQKAREAKHTAKDQANKAQGWFGGKVEEAKPDEDPSQNLGAAVREAADTVSEKASAAGNYVADRFTANPTGNKGRDAREEAERAKDKTKGWFSSKKEDAEQEADKASGWFGARKEEAKDQARSTRGWLSDSGSDSGRGRDGRSFGDAARDKYEGAKDRVSNTFDRSSMELRSRADYDYSNGLIPSDTATERAKLGGRR